MMDGETGTILLIVLFGGIAVWFILQNTQKGSSVVDRNPPPTLRPSYDMSGIGLAGPYGAPLAVAAGPVRQLVGGINTALGTSPFGNLTKQPNGTYKDGSGCTITFKSDGTMTRSCPAPFAWLSRYNPF